MNEAPAFQSWLRDLQPIILESLEARRLASVSYVQVGKQIQPNITAQTASYFAINVPAGDFLIADVGGSMTYFDGGDPPLYHVNDYNESDHGFKVVEPGDVRFDAPGFSHPETNSVVAARQSVGQILKFDHSTAGKIGIEMYDNPIDDNAPGADGSPSFVLKERIVTSTPAASTPLSATRAAAYVGPASTFFSDVPIAGGSIDPDVQQQDTLDLLT